MLTTTKVPSGMDHYFELCYPRASFSDPKIYLRTQLVMGWVSDPNPQKLVFYPKEGDWMTPPDNLKAVIGDCHGILNGIKKHLESYRPTEDMKKVHEDLLHDMQGFCDILIKLSQELSPPAKILRLFTNDYTMPPFYHVLLRLISCRDSIQNASQSLSEVATSLSKNSDKLVDASQKTPIHIKRFANFWQNRWPSTLAIIITILLGLVIGVINVELQVLSIIHELVKKYKYQSLSVTALGLLVAVLASGNSTSKISPNSDAYKVSNLEMAKSASAKVKQRVMNLMDPLGNMDLYWVQLSGRVHQLQGGYTLGELCNIVDRLEDHIEEVLQLANVIQAAFCIHIKPDAPLLVHLGKERSRPPQGAPTL